MKRRVVVLGLMIVSLSTSGLFGLVVNQDGNLSEWVGTEVQCLGIEPGPDGGSYTLFAAWDGAVLNLGVDRDSTNRYLGDDGGTNDSFFIAIDVDGIDNSGNGLDGYQRLNFAGPKRPDVIYYFAGGAGGWHERGVWTGTGWDWRGWTPDNQYYGFQEANPNDELMPDLVTQEPAASGLNQLRVWAWMTREGNGTVTASWPAGHTGDSPTFDEGLLVRDLATLQALPHDPSPAHKSTDVLVDNPLPTFSWTVPLDPNDDTAADPNLVEQKLYISGGLADPNFFLVATIDTWSGNPPRSSFTLNAALNRDDVYSWRVDSCYSGRPVITGDIWTLETELSVPVILSDPEPQIVDPGATATFTVVVESLSTESYQWYRFVDGVSDIALADAANKISGSSQATLTIEDVQPGDEGSYYCIVNNASTIPATSAQAVLSIKRLLACWSFENQDPNSEIEGSPDTLTYGDPEFVAGFDGDGVAFDNDGDNEDLLYTDPEQAGYFDVCNISMTVSAWIKADTPATWGPIVSRNGEDGEGWQLRHNGDTADRVSFTTRGTGNDDGTASNLVVYDDQWHFVVGTFDGTMKKVYVDGVLSRVFSQDDGSVESEFDEVNGQIASTSSPVSIGGRVKGNSVDGLIFEGHSVTSATIDEVKIYNYALTDLQVARHYADATGNPVCPGPLAFDSDGNCIVNMIEFVGLSDAWLSDTRVWPTP